MDTQQFLAEFGHFANAPGGVGRLRELILHLAMTGKLVQQSLTDESAEKLLQRIRALLLATGSRKRKDQKKVNREQTLFKEESLPSGWAIADLGDLGDWGAGSTPSRNNPDFYSGDIPWFKSGELKSDLITKSEESISELALSRCSLRVNVPGDVLIAMYGANIGQTSIVGIKSTTNQAVCACTPHEGLISRFLLLLLRALKNHFISLGAGGAQPNISKEKIIATTVGLPPTAEQVRIIAKVDELMALCDKLEQQQQQRRKLQNALRQSTLQTVATATSPHELQTTWIRLSDNFGQLFTEPEDIADLRQAILDLAFAGNISEQLEIITPELVESLHLRKMELSAEKKIKRETPVIDFPGITEMLGNLPHQWAWVRLNDIASVVRGGSPRPAGDPKFYGGNIPFLKVADVTASKGMFVEGYTSTITEAGLNKTREISTRTVLLTNSGATLGVPAICEFRTTFNDGIAAFIELNEAVFDEYLCLFLKSKTKWLQDIASRGQGQPNLNTEIIRSMWFPLAPIAEQYRVVKRVSELMRICDLLEMKLRKSIEIGERLAIASISSITGIATEHKEESMKAPQTEVIAPLRLGQAPDIKAQAPLSTLLTRHNGEMSAKDLWQRFGGDIDAFYAQLKTEVAHGWIQEPEPAEMREKPPVTAEA